MIVISLLMGAVVFTFILFFLFIWGLRRSLSGPSWKRPARPNSSWEQFPMHSHLASSSPMGMDSGAMGDSTAMPTPCSDSSSMDGSGSSASECGCDSGASSGCDGGGGGGGGSDGGC